MCHSLTWHFVNMVSTGFEEQVLSVTKLLALTIAPDEGDKMRGMQMSTA